MVASGEPHSGHVLYLHRRMNRASWRAGGAPLWGVSVEFPTQPLVFNGRDVLVLFFFPVRLLGVESRGAELQLGDDGVLWETCGRMLNEYVDPPPPPHQHTHTHTHPPISTHMRFENAFIFYNKTGFLNTNTAVHFHFLPFYFLLVQRHDRSWSVGVCVCRLCACLCFVNIFYCFFVFVLFVFLPSSPPTITKKTHQNLLC